MNMYLSNRIISRRRRWLVAVILTAGLVLAGVAYPLLNSGGADLFAEMPALAGPAVGPGGGGGP
jgi:hypothetical protein